jgi:excisionase family DNA binding protein
MDRLLRKPEAAHQLGISVRTLEKFVERGSISLVRLGRRCVRVPESEVDAFIRGARS